MSLKSILNGSSDSLVPGGYREVLKIAIPLVLSTASLTLMLFIDRLFLSWHSQSSVAASTPGGITYFTICSFFLGTAQYVNTLVAQYHGAGDKQSCSKAVWQGIWFSVLSAPLILCMIPVGKAVLRWGGHGPELLELEEGFFTLLMLGGMLLPLNAALSSFFSGRGQTSVVMWGNILANAANAGLDYVLIFGHCGFPELGIYGAGLATALTSGVPTIYWAALFLSRKFSRTHGTRKTYAFDKPMFALLLRFGLPSGMQFFLDVGSFTVFVLLVGRLGEASLAATNIVLSIEMLSFLPMVGMSIATSTLVGAYLGEGSPYLAEKSVRSSMVLALGYSSILALLYMIFPGVFIEIFRPEHDGQFETVLAQGILILRLVAIYTVFDTMFIVYNGALRGAGDTKFTMRAQILLAWFFFIPPVYFMIEFLQWGLGIVWFWAVVYVVK